MKAKTQALVGLSCLIGIVLLIVVTVSANMTVTASFGTMLAILIPLIILVFVVAKRDNIGKKVNWDGIWASSKNTVVSLGVIAGALVFINWLCAEVGWKWWATNREHGTLFWVTQFAILFSVLALMTAKKGLAKVFALMVLVTIAAGWRTIASTGSAEQIAMSTPSTRVTFHVNKGEWSPRVDARSYEATRVTGRILRPDGDDKRKVVWQPGQHIDIAASYVQVYSTDSDMDVTGIPVP